MMKQRITKKDTRNLDKILDLMVQKYLKYEIGSDFLLEDISITRKEIKEKFGFTDLQVSKYLHLMYCKKTTDLKFIDTDEDGDLFRAMDKGIEFYFNGGFQKERIDKIKDRAINYYSVIVGVIVGIIGAISIIYNLFCD